MDVQYVLSWLPVLVILFVVVVVGVSAFAALVLVPIVAGSAIVAGEDRRVIKRALRGSLLGALAVGIVFAVLAYSGLVASLVG
ncbi:MAG: hypothetical protein HY678_02805 [Chloroflexi bacterium]|nr:hypothetical protein [Chloroflexota bacterium]